MGVGSVGKETSEASIVPYRPKRGRGAKRPTFLGTRECLPDRRDTSVNECAAVFITNEMSYEYKLSFL